MQIEPTSLTKNTANGFTAKKKINLMLIFEMTSEFNIQIINSLLHSLKD